MNMYRLIATLAITLLLAFTANSQDDLSKYEVIGTSGNKAFLIRRDYKLDGDRVDFILLIAAISPDSTETSLLLDPFDFGEANILGDCKNKTYQRIKIRGVSEGKKFESAEKSEVLIAKKGTNIFTILEHVCKPPGLSAD